MATTTPWTTTATTGAWQGAKAEAVPKDKPEGEPCGCPCPDCGGLECLCRPRFFAGQLLSEKELNALQSYVVAKNKLHNRYLVGSGIVCGMEAQCDPCGDRVRVTSGYAISPCGEDIVVCKPDLVDICALIAQCQEEDGPDCRPYAGHGKDRCADSVEDWVLTIRYAETSSRAEPVSSAKGCGCGGHSGGTHGGSGGCGSGGQGGSKSGGGGCSCGGSGKASLATMRPSEPSLRRGAPPACLPQWTCETYRYDVFRAPGEEVPERERDPKHPFSSAIPGKGPFVDRLRCCIREIEDAATPLPIGDPKDLSHRQKIVRWICDIRNAYRRLLLRRGGHDCSLIDALNALPIPPVDDLARFETASAEAGKILVRIWFELMLDCLCQALLPSCPQPEDARIPIAVVKVRRGTCEIVSVCNWTPLRKQLVTMPSLSYWLGWLPLFSQIREFLHLMCCEHFGLFDHVRQPEPKDPGRHGIAGTPLPPEQTAAHAAPVNAMMDALGGQSFVARSLDSVMRNRVSGLEQAGPVGIQGADLMALFGGPRGPADASERAAAVDRVFAEMIRPLREAMPAEVLMAGTAGGSQPAAGAMASARGKASAKAAPAEELAALRQLLADQQERIAALEARARATPRARRPRTQK